MLFIYIFIYIYFLYFYFLTLLRPFLRFCLICLDMCVIILFVSRIILLVYDGGRYGTATTSSVEVLVTIINGFQSLPFSEGICLVCRSTWDVKDPSLFLYFFSVNNIISLIESIFQLELVLYKNRSTDLR